MSGNFLPDGTFLAADLDTMEGEGADLCAEPTFS